MKYLPVENEGDLLKVNSSLHEISSFIETELHADFQREISLRIENLNTLLSDQDLKYTGRDYDVFRGGIRAFTEVLNIFKDMQSGLIEQHKINEEETN